MPAALHIYKKEPTLFGSTPTGSHLQIIFLCYKYWNPLDSGLATTPTPFAWFNNTNHPTSAQISTRHKKLKFPLKIINPINYNYSQTFIFVPVKNKPFTNKKNNTHGKKS